MKTKILLTATTFLLFASITFPTLLAAQNLYGMTSAGGTNGDGVLFQFNPSTLTYIKELDFTGANGANPYFTNLMEISPSTALVPALSQWALITLSVLVLGLGVVFVRRRLA